MSREGNAMGEDEKTAFEARLETWERLGFVLNSRPMDLPGLATLASALADRLAITGNPNETAAAAWLSDQLSAAARRPLGTRARLGDA
jgi:hypothetical protein